MPFRSGGGCPWRGSKVRSAGNSTEAGPFRPRSGRSCAVPGPSLARDPIPRFRVDPADRLGTPKSAPSPKSVPEGPNITQIRAPSAHVRAKYWRLESPARHWRLTLADISWRALLSYPPDRSDAVSGDVDHLLDELGKYFIDVDQLLAQVCQLYAMSALGCAMRDHGFPVRQQVGRAWPNVGSLSARAKHLSAQGSLSALKEISQLARWPLSARGAPRHEPECPNPALSPRIPLRAVAERDLLTRPAPAVWLLGAEVSGPRTCPESGGIAACPW